MRRISPFLLATVPALTSLALAAPVAAAPLAPANTAPAVAASADPSVPTAWPGAADAKPVDVPWFFLNDMSGLSFVAGADGEPDRLWAVRNGDGRLFRMVESQGQWVSDTSGHWAQGKLMNFPDGEFGPDAEGVVMVDDVAYVSIERNRFGDRRPGVLRVPTNDRAGSLTATHEWQMRDVFPGIGANRGMESIAHVPNDHLVESGFVDQSTGEAFDPADYPLQEAGGVFFLAVEDVKFGGTVYGYVLNTDGTFHRVAEVANPLGQVMDLEYEADTDKLWITCDDNCDGRSAVLEIDESGAFTATAVHERPAGLVNGNLEGFAIAPSSLCVDGQKPVFWSDDDNNDYRAIWQGSIDCEAPKAVSTVEVAAAMVQAGLPAELEISVGADAEGVTPTGEVEVVAGRTTRKAVLTDGAATVTLPAARVAGRVDYTVSYLGDEGTDASSTSGSVVVTKAVTRLKPLKARVALKKGRKAKLVTAASANGLDLAGAVKVRVGKRLVKAAVRRTDGRIVVTTPRLTKRGPVTVTVAYAGDAGTTAARAVFTVRVR